MAAAAAIVLTSVALPAAKAEVAQPVAKSATIGTGTSTDFSARRRHHRGYNITGIFRGAMAAMTSRHYSHRSYYAPRRNQFFPTGP